MSKGYFRLVGRIGDDPEKFEEIDVVAKQQPFTLGRNDSTDSHLCLGNANNAISREHGKIYWDESASSFMIEILGKNKCAVDKEIRSKGDIVKLSSRSTLRFSNARLYFLIPEPEADKAPTAPVSQREVSTNDGASDGRQKGYAEYVSLAFDAIGGDGKPLSAKNIIDWANDNFAEVREQKRVNLYQGVYTALKRKYEKLEEAVGDRNGFLWRKKQNSADDSFSGGANNDSFNDAMSEDGADAPEN